jgi:hypothetical protein
MLVLVFLLAALANAYANALLIAVQIHSLLARNLAAAGAVSNPSSHFCWSVSVTGKNWATTARVGSSPA